MSFVKFLTLRPVALQPVARQSLALQLNDAQYQAVIHERGPQLIIAGAGSGKTRIITTRIAHLIIEKKVEPASIVALTFTNKAAGEMQERITHFLDQHGQPGTDSSGTGTPGATTPTIGTFHAYALKLLKRYGHLIGLETFSIIDADDQQSLVKKIIERASLARHQPRQAVYHISLLKNSSCTLNPEINCADSTIRQLYQLYEHEKQLAKCLDFDDLLIKTLTLFKTQPQFKNNFQHLIRHILVDEYQDTSAVQHELLKCMALDSDGILAIDSVCAVGDEDQSIYSWRGATIDNIEHFQKDFAGTQIVKVEQNYRSVKPILDTANQLISHNKNRIPKNLWSDKNANNRIAHITCLSGAQEGYMVANMVRTLRNVTDLSNIAILFRTHFQSRALEEALIRYNLPYLIVGGVQFYERKEIKDVLAYLRLAVNPYDRISCTRVINCPARRLGAKFLQDFETAWTNAPFDTYASVAQNMLEQLPPLQRAGLSRFIEVVKGVDPVMPAVQAIAHVIAQTDYVGYLNSEYDTAEAHERAQNVKELINAAQFFAERGTIMVQDFLAEVALLQEHQQRKSGDTNCVQLMTLHAAKGLEFDYVIITGLEENLLPSSKSLESPESIEEERRLLYVGITRTRAYLITSCASYRYTFGTQTYQDPSRFINEFMNSAITQYDCSSLNEWQSLELFERFFSITPKSSGLYTFGRPEKESAIAPARRAIARRAEAQRAEAQRTIVQRAEAQREQVSAIGNWKKLQPVMHQKFGAGLIQSVEQRNDGTAYLTIKFKCGTKRISSTFVSSL